MPQLNNRGTIIQPDNVNGSVAQVNIACNVVTTSNNTITVGIAASTVTFNTACKSFILSPSVTPAAPIFFKYYDPSAASQTAATATTWDRFITESYPAIQEGRPDLVLSFSVITTTTQTLYLAQI